MHRFSLVLAVALAACGDGPTGQGVTDLRAELVAEGLSNPLYLTAPPGDDRLFIVEQAGRIRIVEDGVLLEEPFLDISDRVPFADERGLLSVAFDPDYPTTGRFWIFYVDAADNAAVVEGYRVSADPNVAHEESFPVLRIEKPTTSHNGGLLKFGPDGMLYVGVGDGGEHLDPNGHAQNPGTLLGSLLRLDVRSAAPYAIPAGNPFADGSGGRPEVWAYGLRNPWRFSFDHDDGVLYVADVGERALEEINAVAADAPGVNYGWNVMEGSSCLGTDTCVDDGFTEPVHEYDHEVGCSVIGGYAYRGSRLGGLRGHYFYGDFCQGWVSSFRLRNGVPVDHREWDLGYLGHILSFGEDSAGELYVMTTAGSVFRLVPEIALQEL